VPTAAQISRAETPKPEATLFKIVIATFFIVITSFGFCRLARRSSRPSVVALTLIVVTLVAVPCSAISAIRFMRGDSLSEVCDGGHAERR